MENRQFHGALAVLGVDAAPVQPNNGFIDVDNLIEPQHIFLYKAISLLGAGVTQFFQLSEGSCSQRIECFVCYFIPLWIYSEHVRDFIGLG